MNDKIIYGLTGLTFSNNTIIRPGFTNDLGYNTYFGKTTLTLTAPIEIQAAPTQTQIKTHLLIPLAEDLNTLGLTLTEFYKGTPYLSFGWGSITNSHFINTSGGKNDLLRISSRAGEAQIQLGNSILTLRAGGGNTGIISCEAPFKLQSRTINTPTNTTILSGNNGVFGPTANGTMYWDSNQNKIRVYTGASWLYLQYEP